MTSDGARPPENWQTAGFGIYVHWPFCAAKCPYCDFNSHVATAVDHGAWADAYEADLDRWAAQTQGRVVRSVFFGGGTPSLMAPATVARCLDRIAGHWSLANDVEITLEANPSSVERNRLAAFGTAGINRVSLGVQALNDADLQRLGRLHSAAEALDAVATARALFDRVSFDLIYARQDQSEAAWEGELAQALGLGMDHLSLYQLTVEPGTPFDARARRGGLRGLPDEDRAVRLFEITQSLCASAGLVAYEISNHARPGCESRHNLIYWRGGDWLGIGPGAHGRLEKNGLRWATAAQPAPEAWLEAVAAGGDGLIEDDPLDGLARAEEYLMMSLRLAEGTDLGRLDALGHNLPDRRIAPLEEHGLVVRDGPRLRTTARGKLLLNAVIGELLSG